MSTTRALAELNAMEADQLGWVRDTEVGTERMTFGDLEIRVSKSRLNYGYEWGLFNQDNIVLQGQYAETREDAKRKAIAFAKSWMVDDIRI
jgi:hypothetical protein